MTIVKWGVAALLVYGLSGQAVADELNPPQSGQNPEAAAADPFAALAPMNTDVLEDQRGGVDSVDIAIDDVAINAAQLEAVNTNNSVANSVTGGINQNNISSVSGVNAVMFNTGNNVNMNSSIQVNVFMD